MKKRILIGVPVYVTGKELRDFCATCVASAVSEKYEIETMAVVNRLSEQYVTLLSMFTHVLHNDSNGIALAWNRMIGYAWEQEFDLVIIANQDIEFLDGAIDQIADYHFAREDERNRPILNLAAGFACFSISPSFQDWLWLQEQNSNEPYPGKFDENFIAYYEDNDYVYRLIRLGYINERMGANVKHQVSATIKHDQVLADTIKLISSQSHQYYINKHGGDVGQETYLLSFGKCNTQ